MINKKFIQKLRNDYNKHESERRQIISLSNIILHDSKRVIFALHREDFKKAEESLAEIEKAIKTLDAKFGHSRLAEEGAYKAGMEEFAEANLFYLVAKGKKIEEFEKINLDVDSYIGGICDLTGELVRRAINLAAKGKLKEVEKVKNIINDIMAELVEFDMTGYLRTKYDQAKTNLRKIEQINYEIKIRK